jgi:F0F1-type ATP synthase membrane subunit b/b'
MNKREENINDRVNAARELSEESQNIKTHYQDELNELGAKKDRMLHEIKDEIDTQRNIMLDELRTEIERKRKSWNDEVEREISGITTKTRLAIGQQAITISSQILKDLAGDDLESRIVTTFINKLKKLDDEQKQLISAEGRKHGITIKTSGRLSDQQKQLIRSTIDDLSENHASVQFHDDMSAPLGITMEVPGYTMGWSIESYLSDISEKLSLQIRESA